MRAARPPALVLPVLLVILTAAAPPPDTAPPTVAADAGIGDTPTPVQPGFDANLPPVELPQPKKDRPLDPVIAQLIVARLVQLHLLATPAEARDPIKLGDAIRGFQSSIGSKPTGLLDRKTIALMAL